MMMCLRALFIVLHAFHGGKFLVDPELIESFQESQCMQESELHGWFIFKGRDYTQVSCRMVTLKSGRYEKVTESIDEIANIIGEGLCR